jgi:hypothetical protein
LAHDDAAEAFVARLLGDREDLLAEARRDLAPQAWAAVDRTPVQPPGNDRSAHDARPAATSPRGRPGPKLNGRPRTSRPARLRTRPPNGADSRSCSSPPSHCGWACTRPLSRRRSPPSHCGWACTRPLSRRRSPC